jgi:hypothetical protein
MIIKNKTKSARVLVTALKKIIASMEGPVPYDEYGTAHVFHEIEEIATTALKAVSTTFEVAGESELIVTLKLLELDLDNNGEVLETDQHRLDVIREAIRLAKKNEVVNAP